MRTWIGPILAAMMAGSTGIFGGCAGMLMGCTAVNSSMLVDTSPTGLTADVAAKAQQVAQQIGGVTGCGGNLMNGYMDHMDSYMGFDNAQDLAAAGGHMTIELTNSAGQACTFHVAFLSSAAGIGQQIRDVSVAAGQTVTVDLPCSEIVGMGSIDAVGQSAGQLADGTQFDNRMCVPGFLGSDFSCGGTFRCTLMQDINDLNQNGNTQELIAVTNSMLSHMGPSGMNPHGTAGFFNGMMANLTP